MNKTAEYVSLGHPDKIADYISSALLDECIKHDSGIRYAVEVMVKNNHIILGGEISGNIKLHNLPDCVRQALRDIGYDEEYSQIWQQNAIDINRIEITNLISAQSCEIGRGVEADGWGDQGVFVGYAQKGDGLINRELYLARKLNCALYEKARVSDNLGLDIKTQITLNTEGKILTAVTAIPMQKPESLSAFIAETLEQVPENLIVNGTGAYTCHSSIADCGITGRKLACDFYSAACPIGGGSPWTKDPSKADLTLNLYARKLAIQYLEDNDECFVYLSSCIGKSRLPSAVVKTRRNGNEKIFDICPDCSPQILINELRLRRPIYKKLCRHGLMAYFDDNGNPAF